MAGLDQPTGRNRTDHASGDATASPHLLHYLRILSKRRWTAILTLIAVVGTVAFLTARVVPVYEARAQLMVEVERPRVVVFSDAPQTDTAQEPQDYQETQRRILQSRALASRTIQALGLWQHPAFGGGPQVPPSGLEASLNAVVDWFAALPTRLSKSPNYAHGALIQPEGPDPDETIGFKESQEQSLAIDRFLQNLDVREVGGSRLVDVAFRSADPKLAAAVANGLAEAYIAQNRDFRTMATKEAADWLAEQLEGHRQQLRQSQETLQRYREQRPDASGGEGADLVVRRLESLNAALISARTDRIQKETLHRQVQALQDDQTALEGLPFVQSNASIQSIRGELSQLKQRDMQLAQKLGERHPDRAKVQLDIQMAEQRLKATMAIALERIRSDYGAAQEQEESLVRAVETQKREAMIATGKRAEYEDLARAASTDQEIFATLLQRAKETGVTTGLVASNIRVVDPASVPQSPISPNPRRNLMLALFGGTFMAVGLSLFAEYMDKSITSPEQIRSELGLPCLGLVPVIVGWKRNQQPLLIDRGTPSAFHEAFRTVRTNVLFASRDEPVHTILVTSTGPGEGKTMIAANLAVSLAHTSRRVLLIDADMRRPRMHEIFQHAQSPGLSEAIAGGWTAAQCAVGTSVPGLWLLPSGSIPSNPSELLSSDKYERFIAALPQSFDWVIIDSPPVMAVTDASLIAHVAAGVLFVVAAEKATGPAASNALTQLDAAQARFIGVVLNKVNLKRNAFYYADHYSREYGSYYVKSAPEAARTVRR